MSEEDSSQGPDPSEAEGRGEPFGRGVKASVVVGGAVLGFAGSWVVLFLLLLTTNRGMDAWYATLALLVIAALLLVPRRTRQAGAGMVIGVMIGAIVGAGVCAAMVGTGPVIALGGP